MTDVVSTAEQLTAELATRLLAPRPAECALCYTSRMVDEFGCAGTSRFTLRWHQHHRHSRPDVVRDLAAVADRPRCDCTLLLSVWTLRADLLEWNPLLGALDWPDHAPACAGAPPGLPCAVWVPHPGGG